MCSHARAQNNNAFLVKNAWHKLQTIFYKMGNMEFRAFIFFYFFCQI